MMGPGERPRPASLAIPGLPRPLRWLVPAPRHEQLADGALTIDAGPRTDWFIDPGTGVSTRSAPALLMPAPGTWQLAAFVSAAHRATFDAGVVFVYAGAETWAKLCLERSPQGDVMVVSVATRGVSDDCNSLSVDDRGLHLRVSRLETAFAFHCSDDGTEWRLVRYFGLGAVEEVEVGFIAQSPTGEGCTATFRQITFRPELLTDLRSGA